jgi:hypothetical protein
MAFVQQGGQTYEPEVLTALIDEVLFICFALPVYFCQRFESALIIFLE